MIDGIVEIAEDGRYLSVYRGFLVVADKEITLGRVPLADISALILSANQASLSKNLMVALAEQSTAVICCGKNYLPTSIALPYSGNYESGHRVRSQINASRPLCKQLWRRLVQEKIRNQGEVLSWLDIGESSRSVAAMERRVRSGDPDNLEAQAAKRYWRVAVRPGFVRDRFAEDENLLFNYIYTVLRAAVARAVVGAGLLPALGVHHRGRLNPFSLVDDLMEPYRPLADSVVLELCSEAEPVELTPKTKRRLASVLRLDLKMEKGRSPLCEVLHTLAYSLVQSYEDHAVHLRFGEMLLP
ncbi:type II CRISPR-associated endonuclease Cas1 [Pseudodesulfovibrio thermohalotolerans]|uniref:type II CRISPR-associated endonuclease Cas1 n=1 Tax=Pseudodesulfovibrio thermohalotolerans TaxID=2880651 RepID=UPI0022B9FFC7|nr:type II CRISPR-associated endonuclease Cas1 [Pseudodesulfovibrio thermohalotolerans]WFS63049.1 type II CRISPR-associated endonuclease Cas1 [Pseudodesulfovibrio thermohalotolerans]